MARLYKNKNQKKQEYSPWRLLFYLLLLLVVNLLPEISEAASSTNFQLTEEELTILDSISKSDNYTVEDTISFSAIPIQNISPSEPSQPKSQKTTYKRAEEIPPAILTENEVNLSTYTAGYSKVTTTDKITSKSDYAQASISNIKTSLSVTLWGLFTILALIMLANSLYKLIQNIIKRT